MGYEDILKLISSNKLLEETVVKAKKMHKQTKEMVRDSWIALEKDDKYLARKVIKRDARIDVLDEEIRKNVLVYLASMPVGGNISFSLILIDISTSLERIADHATWIAETALDFKKLRKKDYVAALDSMYELIAEMLENVEVALGSTNSKKAEEVLKAKQKLKRQYRELIDKTITNTMSVEDAIPVWSAARNFLRIGYYCENIAKTVLEPYPEAK